MKACYSPLDAVAGQCAFLHFCTVIQKTSSTSFNQNNMKRFIASLLFSLSLFSLSAQTAPAEYAEVKAPKSTRFGIKGGYNIAKYTGSAPDFKPDAKNGFMAAVYYSPSASKGLGFRTELVFSRQGFGFDEAGKQSTITSDYIYLPQFTTISITRFVQLQVGGQIGYLLQSSKRTESTTGSSDLTSFANRIDYGAAFGAEIYPFKGLILGGRYNMSFGESYKQPTLGGGIPSPLPFNPADVKGKNAVINFYLGYRF